MSIPLGSLRMRLLVLGIGIWTIIFAACSSPSTGRSKTGAVKIPQGYIIGADISSVPQAEARGIHYSENGVARDILEIMKAHGFNYIRLRVFVEPKNPGGYAERMPEGFCDLSHTIALARRVKAAGMGLLIDFHYSDTWADPGKQTKPLAWRDLALDDLVKKIHDYTKDAIAQLKAAGATPDMVQIGNEITPGMLLNRLPAGRGGEARTVSTQPEGSTRDWNNLAALLKAGIAGVKEVDPKILIMLHIDKGGNNAVTRTWVDNALSHGVVFDILGESCYSRVDWQGPPEGWKANFDDLVQRYPQLSFIIAEYGLDIGPANDIMLHLPDRKGLGTFIWEPTQNGNQQGLFNNQGGTIPRLEEYDPIKQAAAKW